MRNKKLLSTIVATSLVATMAMPVMAADGEVDIDVTTKTGVLRVEVPTSMAVAVDQFEIANAGAQIYSEEFPMVNKSEIAVQVDVTSTVTVGSGVELVASKDGLTGNQAWLATAAMTASGSYDITATADTTENAWDLSEANSNVATFGTDKTAKQTFYLEKADDSADVEYKMAITDANKKGGESYAKFYELTPVSITVDNSTETSQLQNAVNADDVYVVENDTTSSPQKPEADGKAMTKIAKGTDLANANPAITYAATNNYYTAAAEASALDASKKYVYAAMNTAGTNGAAGFTYIGKLSDEKATWTNTDISNIKIEYDITGVTATNYGDKATNCTYGLYTEPVPAPTEVTGTKITNGSGKSIYSTSAALASRLQSGSVQFLFDTTTNDVSDLEVSKIVVDGTEYDTTKMTVTENTAASASSDGKLYELTGFTAATADVVEVYYGNSIVVKYTFS